MTMQINNHLIIVSIGLLIITSLGFLRRINRKKSQLWICNIDCNLSSCPHYFGHIKRKDCDLHSCRFANTKCLQNAR